MNTRKTASNSEQPTEAVELLRTETMQINRESHLFFGPIGKEQYLSYGPLPPNNPQYAIELITSAFGTSDNQLAIDDRRTLWSNYETLVSHLTRRGENHPKDIVRALYSFVEGLEGSVASRQLGVKRVGLGLHLQDVCQLSKSFLLDGDSSSRLPALVSDRHAALLTDIVSPLHDLLKYLGTPAAQILPDHEIMLAEVIKNFFTGQKAILNGKKSTLTVDDVEFIAALCGDHENIHKEAGRGDYIHSLEPIKRAKALFSFIDTLAGAFVESETTQGSWQLNAPAFDSRFIDLCFRHLDPVLGKIYRPEWILAAVTELTTTITIALDSAGFSFSSPEQHDIKETLVKGALTAIKRAFAHDDQRREMFEKNPNRLLSEPQRVEINMLAKNLKSLL